jgi:hypothetical protein
MQLPRPGPTRQPPKFAKPSSGCSSSPVADVTKRRSRVVVAAAVVAAVLGSGVSAAMATFTKSVSASGSFSTAALVAPSGLTVSAPADLSWTASASSWADGTQVLRSTTVGGPYTVVASISGVSTTTFSDAPGSGTYYYAVRTYFGSNWVSPTSNEVVRQDPQLTFAATTGFTGTNCATGTVGSRDMAQDYAPSGTESTFTGVSSTGTIVFCSRAFTAGEAVAAGNTAVDVYVDNSAGSACMVTVTVSVNGVTTLGSADFNAPANSGTTLHTWTLATSGATFADGDRLNLKVHYNTSKSCNSTTLHYDGASTPSAATVPGLG